jgi:hypothetical protein
VDIVSVEEPWQTAEEIEALKPALMLTAGVVIKEDPEYIVLVSTVEVDGNTYGNANVIPRGCIRELKELKELGSSGIRAIRGTTADC